MGVMNYISISYYPPNQEDTPPYGSLLDTLKSSKIQIFDNFFQGCVVSLKEPENQKEMRKISIACFAFQILEYHRI